MQTLYKICLVLLIIGGLNWGLVGLFSFNLVGWLFGGVASVLSRIIFVIVGVAAICAIPSLFSSASGSGSEQYLFANSAKKKRFPLRKEWETLLLIQARTGAYCA